MCENCSKLLEKSNTQCEQNPEKIKLFFENKNSNNITATIHSNSELKKEILNLSLQKTKLTSINLFSKDLINILDKISNKEF